MRLGTGEDTPRRIALFNRLLDLGGAMLARLAFGVVQQLVGAGLTDIVLGGPNVFKARQFAQFVGHPMAPQFQEARIRVEGRGHPIMRGFDEEWVHTEEWYSFEKSPRGPGTLILASVDESSYTPTVNFFITERDIAMGADHPVIWTHCIGRGHSIYSALGHRAEAYADEKHLTFLEEGIAWLIRTRHRDCMVPA